MPEKIITLVFAHNEAETIGPLLDSLKPLAKTIVVDDGSTDATPKIAKRKGVEVLSLGKNYGKAYGFYKGAQEAKKQGASVLVTLDADLEPVPKQKFDALVNPVLERRAEMNIGGVYQDSTSMSGQRAIRMKAIDPLLRGNKKWERYFGVENGNFRRRIGYGLEKALNICIGGQEWPGLYSTKKIATNTELAFRATREMREKNPDSGKIQNRELKRVIRIRDARIRLARAIKARRKKARRAK